MARRRYSDLRITTEAGGTVKPTLLVTLEQEHDYDGTHEVRSATFSISEADAIGLVKMLAPLLMRVGEERGKDGAR